MDTCALEALLESVSTGSASCDRAQTSAGQAPSTIAEQLAAELAEKLEAAGYRVAMETYTDLAHYSTAAFSRLVSDREQAAYDAKKARRDAWVAERGLLTWQEAAERLGLTSAELYAAKELDIVRSVEVPSVVVGYAFMRDQVLEVHELTPAEREQIAANVFARATKRPRG